MAKVAGLVVSELRRRGELNPVTVAGAADPAPDLFVLRESRRLVDLGSLETADGPVPSGPRAPAATSDLADGVDDMLGAMEEAQNLEIGDPRSGEIGVILAGILRLLARFTPQFRIFVLLHEATELPEGADAVLVVDEGPESEVWLEVREPGSAAWMPSAAGLPAGIRRALAPEAGFRPVCAAAVPLHEPSLSAAGLGPEVGILVAVAGETWQRDVLLRLGERLSRFVTRRWQQQVEVNQRIHTDSLTGVFNRAYFDTQFTLELERARRSQIPLTLIIADIDHFKAVNDRHGHQAGDAVLVTVARRLQDELRRIDHVCRIGGEEFALILPDTSEPAAREVMRRLLAEAFVTTCASAGGEIAIPTTVSYGAVTFPAAGVDAFELYRKADAMLYLSKDSGRHRCHFWNSSGDHVEMLPESEASS